MAGVSEFDYFARLVEALEPWLDSVVIIGGWAHLLYRLHPLAQPLNYEPLGTFDADVAVPLDLPATGEQIRERLLAQQFREELMGDTQPPAAHYRVQSGDNSFYAELLTPLEGCAVKRGGKRDVTVRISGVPVQKLRYLEILLRNPSDVMIAPALGYPTPVVRRILVPNPGSVPRPEDLDSRQAQSRQARERHPLCPRHDRDIRRQSRLDPRAMGDQCTASAAGKCVAPHRTRCGNVLP
jgi:hypothetical protein